MTDIVEAVNMKREIAIILSTIIILTGATACGKKNEDIKTAPEVSSASPTAIKTSIETVSSDNPQETSAPGGQDATAQDREAKAKAKEVITAIKEKDMEKLSSLAHPEKGIRFSPYAYVNTKQDKVFAAADIKTLAGSPAKYTWGNYDGSGEPIELTFDEYYAKFIYDLDFANAKEIAWNQTLGKGNTTNNSAEVYPDAAIIEYHFPGIDPTLEGIDWRSLRLVLEQKDGAWYLVGIIHDQWTI